MTDKEIMVVAAAAAVFVLINIIMWTAIAKKNKKEKLNVVSLQKNPVPEPVRRNSAPDVQINEKTVDTPMRGKIRFNMIDNIVITHSEENLN